MPKITRYFPGFVDVDDSDRVTVEFSGADDLLAVPWVKRWASDRDFSYYAISGKHLMAVLKDGFESWVVGIMDSPPIGIREHDGGKYLIVMDGKPYVARGRDISSISGNVAILRSGERVEVIRP